MRGICILSTIPVRREPDSTSEITTMLLFGDTFSVSEQENGWSYIKNDFDGYTGWVSSRQVEKLHREPKRSIPCAGFPFLRANTKNGPVFILSGSSIPDPEGSSFTINDEKYELDLPNVSYKPSDIIYVAKEYLNAPYLWGGRSPFGIDCSGFTQAVFKICGMPLLRDAWQQAEMGETVSFREQVQPGDLAFFDNDEGRITHVGIMLNPDKIIHASARVRIDVLDQHGIYSVQENKYTHKLRIIKRIGR